MRGICSGPSLFDRHHPEPAEQTIEIHAPDFGCYIDGDIDSPTATDQELPIRSETKSTPDFESIEYRLPSPLSNRLAT